MCNINPKKSEVIRKIGLGILCIFSLVLAVILLQKVFLFEKYKDIVLALDEVSKTPYSDNWKCLDFSKDLAELLNEKGIKSKIEIVKREGIEDEYHAVISLQIDPQNGAITNHQVVDSCVLENGKIECEKGMIEGKDSYVVSRAK